MSEPQEKPEEVKKDTTFKKILMYGGSITTFILIILAFSWGFRQEKISPIAFIWIIVAFVALGLAGGYWWWKTRQKREDKPFELSRVEAELLMHHAIARKFAKWNIYDDSTPRPVPIPKTENFKFEYMTFRLTNGKKIAYLINRVHYDLQDWLDVTEYVRERDMIEYIAGHCEKLANIERKKVQTITMNQDGTTTTEIRDIEPTINKQVEAFEA